MAAPDPAAPRVPLGPSAFPECVARMANPEALDSQVRSVLQAPPDDRAREETLVKTDPQVLLDPPASREASVA